MTKKSAYEKYCDGDSFCNDELTNAIQDFYSAERALLKLGRCFEIQRKECTRVLIGLQGFADARGLSCQVV